MSAVGGEIEMSMLRDFLEEKTYAYKLVKRKSQKKELLQAWSIQFGASGLNGNDRFSSFKTGLSSHNRARGKHALRVFGTTRLRKFNLLIYGALYQITLLSETTAHDFATMILSDNPEMMAWDDDCEWCLFLHHEGEIAFAYK